MQVELEIVELAIDDIAPYENNTRSHHDGDVEAIAASITAFGFNDPIGIWSDKNFIVEGHGRLEAAKRLGLVSVPCIRLDHLTDEQRRAYALAHNKTAELSEWDPSKLAEELADLSDFDMADFGFDVGELNDEVGETVSPESFGEDFVLPDGEKPEITKMSFVLHERQKELIEYSMSVVKDSIGETFGNTNKNGNALYEVVRQWAEQRK